MPVWVLGVHPQQTAYRLVQDRAWHHVLQKRNEGPPHHLDRKEQPRRLLQEVLASKTLLDFEQDLGHPAIKFRDGVVLLDHLRELLLVLILERLGQVDQELGFPRVPEIRGLRLISFMLDLHQDVLQQPRPRHIVHIVRSCAIRMPNEPENGHT